MGRLSAATKDLLRASCLGLGTSFFIWLSLQFCSSCLKVLNGKEGLPTGADKVRWCRNRTPLKRVGDTSSWTARGAVFWVGLLWGGGEGSFGVCSSFTSSMSEFGNDFPLIKQDNCSSTPFFCFLTFLVEVSLAPLSLVVSLGVLFALSPLLGSSSIADFSSIWSTARFNLSLSTKSFLSAFSVSFPALFALLFSFPFTLFFAALSVLAVFLLEVASHVAEFESLQMESSGSFILPFSCFSFAESAVFSDGLCV